MITKEVQFTKTDKTGKETSVKVMLGYCFGTEIMFHELAGENVSKFAKECIESISREEFVDDPRTNHLIMAAVGAYYESIGKKAPITEKDLRETHYKKEIGELLGTVLGMYIKMNTSPAGESDEKKKDTKEEDPEDPKNV